MKWHFIPNAYINSKGLTDPHDHYQRSSMNLRGIKRLRNYIATQEEQGEEVKCNFKGNAKKKMALKINLDLGFSSPFLPIEHPKGLKFAHGTNCKRLIQWTYKCTHKK